MPKIFAHSAIVLVSPLYSIRRLFLLLFACAKLSTQRQFNGLYPSSLSLRSSVRFSEYPLAFAQSRKFSKLRHSSHTVIPRPPYLSHAGLFGLEQRLHILPQILYTLTDLPEVFDGVCDERHRPVKLCIVEIKLVLLLLQNIWSRRWCCC